MDGLSAELGERGFHDILLDWPSTSYNAVVVVINGRSKTAYVC